MRRAIQSQWMNLSSLHDISTLQEACILGTMTAGEEMLLMASDVKPSVLFSLRPTSMYSKTTDHSYSPILH
ncbi:hypothetical protein ABE099_15690 [Paenibacillus turicensis]|uniref:hypothetical protein n=1 Tax=Paenibacillus turicensis TaxID=160487 RepID=UPI003D278854